jgi:hypothetical protein
MVDLVFWSFVVALTPVALGLAWKLVSGIGNWIGLVISRPFEDDEQWGPLRPLSFNPPSGSISVAGMTPGLEAGRSAAPSRRRLS